MNPDKPNPHTTIHPPAGSHHVHEAPPMHDAPDEWHDHTRDEAPQHAHGEVQNSNLVMGVGIALTAVITISCLVVFGFYTHYNTERSSLREAGLRRTVPGLAPSPADETRAEKNRDLLDIQKGKSFAIPGEADGTEKPVTLAPMSEAAQKVAHTLVSQFPKSTSK